MELRITRRASFGAPRVRSPGLGSGFELETGRFLPKPRDVASRVFCIAEDRPSAETGLRVLLVSLAQHEKGTPTVLYRPGSSPEFTEWCRQWSWLEIVPERPAGGFEWNCKPQALRPLLDRGFDEAIWLDSDLMLQTPLARVLDGLPAETLAVTQDSRATNKGEFTLEARTRAWNWPLMRAPMDPINTCLIRVTAAHRTLLTRWEEAMNEARYVEWARQPVGKRPPYFTSDQDVLMALLGGPEFGSLPLRVLPTGSAVLHCAGLRSFTWSERWRATTQGPAPLVHATTDKPWIVLSPRFGRSRRERLTQLAHELSPYVVAARTLQTRLGQPAPWLEFRTPLGRFLGLLGWASPGLAGGPLTLAASLTSRR